MIASDMEDIVEPEGGVGAPGDDLSAGDMPSCLLDPVPAERFHGEGDDLPGEQWANINRAPHDRVSGVVYKRAAHIKAVRYDLATAPPHPTPCTRVEGNRANEPSGSSPGQGNADIRWLFSEVAGTEEGLLRGRTFGYLQDLALEPGASTPETAQAERDTVIYVVAGRGELAHRPTTGSPRVVRPLRPGDAALIEAGELYSLSNAGIGPSMRLMILGLRVRGRLTEDMDERD